MKITIFFLSMICLPITGYAYCYADASNRYGVPERLLRAIEQVESSGSDKATNLSHVSKTKSYDIGRMQINSSWLPKLASFGITEAMLRDPCQNIMVGAWILSHSLRSSGANWNGVGAYNASCRKMTQQQCANTRNTYSWKVYRALMQQQNLMLPGGLDKKRATVNAIETQISSRKKIITVDGFMTQEMIYVNNQVQGNGSKISYGDELTAH